MVALEVRGNNMALLTEEQINDILDITNVCESSIVVSKLIEWNEKQTTQQFEVDWSKAPEGAKNAVLEFWWLDINGNKIEDKKWEVLNKPC